jgi:hypothetical protein
LTILHKLNKISILNRLLQMNNIPSNTNCLLLRAAEGLSAAIGIAGALMAWTPLITRVDNMARRKYNQSLEEINGPNFPCRDWHPESRTEARQMLYYTSYSGRRLLARQVGIGKPVQIGNDFSTSWAIGICITGIAIAALGFSTSDSLHRFGAETCKA